MNRLRRKEIRARSGRLVGPRVSRALSGPLSLHDHSRGIGDPGPFWCVICGGDHRSTSCSQCEGRCYRCGQAGHLSRECRSEASPAPSAASVQSTPRQLAGLSPAMSAGRPSLPRQPKGSQSAPSGRVFAVQVEEPAVVDDVMPSIVLINGTRSRALFDTGASNSFINVIC